MTSRSATLASLCALAVALPGAAAAQAPSAPEVVSIRGDYELGRFEQALERAEARLATASPELAEPEQLELHQLAGLAAFNLGRQPEAERHFAAVLRLDPDHALDPFQVPPPAIAVFERLRKELAATLESVRYERKLRAERLQREADQHAAEQAEAARRAADQLAGKALAGRSFLVNFVPFGAGQFQQGRFRTGVAFAAGEALLGAASVIGYWQYASLITTRSVTLDNRQVAGERFTVTERGIPAELAGQAAAWRWVQLGAGAAFYAAWAAGAVDAVLHHGDPPGVVSLQIVPLSGGAAAGLTARF